MCSALSSVSSIERFVARYIRGQIPQPIVEKALGSQEHARHRADMSHGMRHLSDPLGDRLSVRRSVSGLGGGDLFHESQRVVSKKVDWLQPYQREGVLQ